MKLAYQMLLAFCYAITWLHLIDVIIKIIIQEIYLDIHLSYLIVKTHHNGYKYYDGFEHDYWWKGSFIVETMFWIMTFSYYICNISLNISTYSCLPLVDRCTPMSFIPSSAFIRPKLCLRLRHINITHCKSIEYNHPTTMRHSCTRNIRNDICLYPWIYSILCKYEIIFYYLPVYIALCLIIFIIRNMTLVSINTF